MTFVDPVTQGNEYQRMLLSYLGDDDPAEVQQAAAERWHALLGEAGADLRKRPADGEWSIVELLGHAADAELVASGRYRWILAHDRPALMPYDQDLWATSLGHRDTDASELLDLFESLRRANLALWARSTPEQRARVGMHQERGPESYDLTFRLIAGHDRFHLEQAHRTLEQVRAAT
ncbi:MAG: hypothetical protein QOH61_2113 [Chloroflexota bacterium]|jgi:hypothetical protein|nr:hypothetical protein [Chloroflexota bacterium]